MTFSERRAIRAMASDYYRAYRVAFFAGAKNVADYLYNQHNAVLATIKY
jgi:hypothetical protein